MTGGQSARAGLKEENRPWLTKPIPVRPNSLRHPGATVVTKAAQVAVTAPAVALLLNATSKSAFAQIGVGSATARHILDDFTFGNTEEDIDAIAQGSNFNPQNGVKPGRPRLICRAEHAQLFSGMHGYLANTFEILWLP